MAEKFLNSKWTKLWFTLSVLAFVGLTAATGSVGKVAGVLSLLFFCIAGYKSKVYIRLFESRSRKHTLIMLTIAICIVVILVLLLNKVWTERVFYSENLIPPGMRAVLPVWMLWMGQYLLPTILGIAALFFVFALVWFIAGCFKNRWHPFKSIGQALKRIVKSSDSIERWYMIIGAVVFIAFVVLICRKTEVGYQTNVPYDVVFTTDSGILVKSDAFFNINHPQNNDIRQPLFAITTIPFAAAAKILSRIAPLSSLPSAYILIIQLMQVIFLLITAILLLRMSGITDKFSKIAFLVLYSFSYPVLLYSFVVEQYIASTFILILTIYISCYKKRQNAGLLALASGTLLTNSIIVPFVTARKEFSLWLRFVAKVVLYFLAMCVVCGKFRVLLRALVSIDFLLGFSSVGSRGTVDTIGKLTQFSHFIMNTFTSPQTEVVEKAGSMVFQLTEPQKVSVCGLVLLAVALASAIINRKLLCARICGLWSVFSIALLFIVGWGAPENGMILYSLYFGWALFTLVFLFCEKLFERHKPIRYAVYSAAFAIMAITNANGIAELVRFGMQYYPAG